MNRFIILCLLFAINALQAQVNLGHGLQVCMPVNADASDHSGNGNHGTIVGSVSLTANRFGTAQSAFLFSGQPNARVILDSLGSFLTENELTIALWARKDLHSTTCLFLLAPDDAHDRCVGCAMYPGHGMIWDYGDIMNKGRLSGSLAYNNNWHHYTFVASGSQGEKKIYVDGVLIAADTIFSDSLGLQNGAKPLYIGGGTSDLGGGSLWWNGAIDEIMIYDRPLSAAEVTALYNLSEPVCSVVTETAAEAIRLVTIFPVPSTGSISISASSWVKRIDVTGIDGRLFMTLPGTDKLDLSVLDDGIYLVQLSGSDFELTRRVVIAR